ncbi:MAG: hypothetical protein JST00_40170 [Deltaproteobacteria bacterium]|nr:hypothetical protein [Deltaproteobacteria bacterium]
MADARREIAEVQEMLDQTRGQLAALDQLSSLLGVEPVDVQPEVDGLLRQLDELSEGDRTPIVSSSLLPSFALKA